MDSPVYKKNIGTKVSPLYFMVTMLLRFLDSCLPLFKPGAGCGRIRTKIIYGVKGTGPLVGGSREGKALSIVFYIFTALSQQY